MESVAELRAQADRLGRLAQLINDPLAEAVVLAFAERAEMRQRG